MRAIGRRISPASLWRAFFFSCLASLALGGPKPGSAPATPYLQLGRPDQDEGARALAQLRRQGIPGDYFLGFQLRVMPRRGGERLFTGSLWGSQNTAGTVSRVQLGAGASAEVRLLIQNGPQPSVWRMVEGESLPVALTGRALFEPVAPGTEVTPFDLQMPFIHWVDFSYEGLARFRGRPAHVFLMRPPADLAGSLAGRLTGVRVQLDTQFNALVQVELLGSGGRVTKTTTLVDLKKVGDQWIVKTIDVRDELTRNKTRFSVTGAALGLEFSPIIFERERLGEIVAPPAPSVITPVAN